MLEVNSNQFIDKGTFGSVYSSPKEKDIVYKIVDKTYKNFFEQEINILKLVNGNEYCCNMLSYNILKNKLILKFPKYYKNFYEIEYCIKGQEFIRITLQLLNVLEYFNSILLIHGDLKPENIMFEDEKCVKIKVIDFGLSKKLNKHDVIYSSYYQSRWYASPDTFLGKKITTHIDLWSMACILYEINTKLLLFQGRKSDVENCRNYQLLKIIEVIGLPDDKFIKDCIYKNKYFSNKFTLLNSERKYNLIDKFNKDYIIKPESSKLDDKNLELELLIILKLILRYQFRPNVSEIIYVVKNMVTNKKIKVSN